MRQTLFIFLLGMLFFQCGKAQTTRDTVVYYLKNSGALAVNRDSADYLLLYLPKNTGTKLFPLLEVYKNGTRKLMGSAPVRSSTLLLEGPATSFYPNGRKKTVATFANGYPVGDMYSFYPNGKLYFYKTHSKYDNKNRVLLMDCRDSTGKVLAENGNGTWIGYDDDLKYIAQEGQVVNGLKEGEWHGAAPDVVKYTCTYKDGETVSGVGYDRAGNPHPFTKEHIEPRFDGGKITYHEYMARNVHYPYERENYIPGQVEVAYFIETDGTLTNANIIKSLSPGIDDVVLKAIERSPRWVPGLQFGVPTRMPGSYLMKFGL